MQKVSFEGIGALTATFACEDGVEAGQVVKLTGPGLVGPCGAGDRPCGVARSARDGFAAVQLKGFATVSASGGVTEGWASLAADGQGGLMPAGTESGTVYLVAETGGGSAVVLL